MNEQLRPATLLFLVDEEQILLAMKKRGFGKGKYNGAGGKPEGDETLEQTAVRECQEEVGVTPKKFREAGILKFFFDNNPDWNQQVHVYICNEWSDDPVETDEMSPSWFNISDIPYDEMWQDDSIWLPKVLAGNYVSASFQFDEDQELKDYDIVSKPLEQ